MRKRGTVVGIYLAAILFYGFFVSLFSSTVHVGVDEEIYLALAKSFHYHGRFEIAGEPSSYTCILYSALISVAYYFYAPETILLFIRLIGVLTMCSAVFPIALLAQKILQDEKKVLKLCVVSMTLPYMFDCAYLMQEVLSYPLFLWTLYFFYCAHENAHSYRVNIHIAICAFFSVLCFFTKTYLFFIPVAINILYFHELITKKERKKTIKKVLSYDVVYLILTCMIYVGIRMTNGFAQGSDHYGNQFQQLFPMEVSTVVCGIFNMLFYLAFLFWNMGMVPMLSLYINNQYLKEGEGKTAEFCKLSLALLVIEIVVLIVMTEERGEPLPHKFLFRYFQIFVPIVLILFERMRQELISLTEKWVKYAIGGFTVVPMIYFLILRGDTRQSIIDGHFFLLLENATKYIIPYADVIIVGICGGMLVYLIWKNGKSTEMLFRKITLLGGIAIGIMFIVNCFQLPFYNNVIAGGKQIQKDSIKIADYLNENEYELVYYIENEDYYLGNFYGYIKQPHKVIKMEDLEQCLEKDKDKKTAVISGDKMAEKSMILSDSGLDTEKITLYTIL